MGRPMLAGIAPCVLSSATEGMRGLDCQASLRDWIRRGLGACMALLLWTAPLAPVAAQAPGASGACACCHGKQICICHRRHTSGGTDGPAISTASCNTGCCQRALSGRTAGSGLPLKFEPWTPAFSVVSQAAIGGASDRSRGTSLNLRQRPPPLLPRI
jgi:hypothetical protein